MATTSFQTYYSKQTGTQAKVLTGITLDGTENLLASLDGLRARGEASVPKILYRIAEQIMTEAKGQTPVDTGNLRASGHVLPPEWIGNWVLVMLGFGGPAGAGKGQKKDAGYAVYVHENLAARHKVGNAKYLERPMLAWASKLEAKIGADLRTELERR
jgi:hypothetical protein